MGRRLSRRLLGAFLLAPFLATLGFIWIQRVSGYPFQSLYTLGWPLPVWSSYQGFLSVRLLALAFIVNSAVFVGLSWLLLAFVNGLFPPDELEDILEREAGFPEVTTLSPEQTSDLKEAMQADICRKAPAWTRLN